MEFTGEIKNVTQDWVTGEVQITLSCNEKAALLEVDSLKGSLLSIIIKKFFKKRSKNANALMWQCLGEIAAKRKVDTNWDVYLEMLRKYGIYTQMYVDENDVPKIRKQWRELEVISAYEGTACILCYYGSHVYNTEEFSRLLNGIITEMISEGLQPPTSKEMQRSLELWEKQNRS